MLNANAVVNVCTSKYAIPIMALWICAAIVLHKFDAVRPFSVPKAVDIPHKDCVSVRREMSRLQSTKTPPWISLLADYRDTVNSRRNLYLWPSLPRRLGNILFNYAVTFGIAWHNRRIPLWPERPRDKRYDIANFFNLRIPVDKNKTIMQVRTSSSLML